MPAACHIKNELLFKTAHFLCVFYEKLLYLTIRLTSGKKYPLLMLKQFAIIALLILFNKVAVAQNPFDNLKVIKTSFDFLNNAAVIPDSIFSMQPDLLYVEMPFFIFFPTEKYGFDIRWPANSGDNSFILRITKRQIYLVTTHDNPNANHLYWFTNITPRQYEIIADKINKEKFLFKRVPYHSTWFQRLYYEKYKPERPAPMRTWTEKDSEKYYRDWREKRYQNTAALISWFNAGLRNDDLIPFVTREVFDKIESVRIVYSEEDYEGQIKLVRPPSNPK